MDGALYNMWARSTLQKGSSLAFALRREDEWCQSGIKRLTGHRSASFGVNVKHGLVLRVPGSSARFYLLE